MRRREDKMTDAALTFEALREGNLLRQEYWGGSDNWTLADWSNAVAGEVGEACNVVKKLRRFDLGTTGNKHSAQFYRDQLQAEIGDVLIYLDLLANKAGLDLGACARHSFNAKSVELTCR
jgi:NTP pyrophosphatase (non-canonical NTP hydrolase)